jgi:rRNA processing protein Krr1/Pno1
MNRRVATHQSIELADPPSKMSKTESSSRASSSEGDDCSGPGADEQKAAGDATANAVASTTEAAAEGVAAAAPVPAADDAGAGAAPPASAPAAITVGADGIATAATAAATAAAAAPPAEPEVEEKASISPLYVGRVIGKGGEMVRDLQARSGCRIDLDQTGPDKIITYRGTRAKIDFAKNLVAILCQPDGKPEDLPLGEAQRKVIFVPATVIGKIIGRGGEMIRSLQNQSAAKIQVDHSGAGADPNQRQITVIGAPASAVKAEEMVNFIAANPQMDAMAGLQMLVRDKTSGGSVWGSGPPYANMPNGGVGMTQADQAYYGQPAGGAGGYGPGPGGYGPGAAIPPAAGPGGTVTDTVPVAKTYMGRIIGQKGVTINDLQRKSGCDIQINQDVAPGQDCQITITGPPTGVQAARQMLQEIIEMGPNHPYAGGANRELDVYWLPCLPLCSICRR